MPINRSHSKRQTGRFGYEWMLLCFLVCTAFLGFSGTPVSQGISSSNSAFAGVNHHGWQPAGRDRSGEVGTDGFCLVDSADCSLLLPEIRPTNHFFAALAVPVARQLPGELHAYYFRPPPAL